MEEEARRLLKREASAPERLGDLAVRLFDPAHGEPPVTLPEREIHEPMLVLDLQESLTDRHGSRRGLRKRVGNQLGSKGCRAFL